MSQVDYFKFAKEMTEYKAGDVIFAEGDQGDVMYAIREGEVELSVKGKVLSRLGAGHFFGEMALVDKAARSARAVAATDVKLVQVDRHRFLFLVQETPTFALQVMQVMAENLRKMNELIQG